MMKILLISLLLLLVLTAKSNKTAEIYTEEELQENKEFIACHNLGRIKSTEHYAELEQLDETLDAQVSESLLRYMIDVIHNCLEKVSSDNKALLFDSFLNGEEIPTASYISDDIFLDISTLKTLGDLRIPKEQNETQVKANANGHKFRATLDHFISERKKEEKKNSQGLHILGFNIDNVGNGAKAIYALLIIGLLAYFFKIVSGVIFKEDSTNSKHQPPKRRNRANRNKRKAKTT